MVVEYPCHMVLSKPLSDYVDVKVVCSSEAVRTALHAMIERSVTEHAGISGVAHKACSEGGSR